MRITCWMQGEDFYCGVEHRDKASAKTCPERKRFGGAAWRTINVMNGYLRHVPKAQKANAIRRDMSRGVVRGRFAERRDMSRGVECDTVAGFEVEKWAILGTTQCADCPTVGPGYQFVGVNKMGGPCGDITLCLACTLKRWEQRT